MTSCTSRGLNLFGAAEALANNVDTTVNLNKGTPNEDPPCVVLVVVVWPPLINVGSAAVLLGLPGRQATISPAGFLTVAPSRRPPVAVAVSSVFVPVAALPTLIIILEMLVSVVLVSVVCNQCRSEQAQRSKQCEYCKRTFANESSRFPRVVVQS